MIKKMEKFFRSIKNGTKNLVIWFPAIWRDRDWDHFYLYIILRKKLSNMENYHRKYGYSVISEKTADNIKLCVNLLDRLIEDKYCDELFKKHDKKWGKLDFVPLSEPGKSILTREKIKSKKDDEAESKEFKRLWKHEETLKKQDIDYLFKFMSKHIQCWWD